jgi:hypothetical protein
MTLPEFLQLDFHSKIAVANETVCIGGRSTHEHMILLYQQDSFYIEIYYNKKGNYITAVNGFDDLMLLDPYLEKIDIRGVLSSA